MRAAAIVFAGALALGACDSTPTVRDAARADAEPVGPGLPVDHPPVAALGPSRAPSRLTVQMLAASVPIIAGDDASGAPIRWTLRKNGRDVDALSAEGLARTLGAPDYIQITDEAAEPTPLYAKLMDDMARDVCGKMAAADLAAAGGSAREPVLGRFASLTAPSPEADVRANLRYLALRFFGQRISDDAGVADLEAVYDAALAGDTPGTGDARAAWTAVCVALFLSPSFHLY